MSFGHVNVAAAAEHRVEDVGDDKMKIGHLRCYQQCLQHLLRLGLHHRFVVTAAGACCLIARCGLMEGRLGYKHHSEKKDVDNLVFTRILLDFY